MVFQDFYQACSELFDLTFIGILSMMFVSIQTTVFGYNEDPIC